MTHRKNLWGCQLHRCYPPVKLLDYRGRETELEIHADPFAVVVLAHLKAQDHDPRPGRVGVTTRTSRVITPSKFSASWIKVLALPEAAERLTQD